ncbi:MAG TPA: hypothetical protein ENN39_03405 [Desulfonatronum sp.]|nr:hypothetical protein [Desulfonatronum sp.]
MPSIEHSAGISAGHRAGPIVCSVLAALLAFAVCLGLRLTEAPAWDRDFLQVQGEPLMATHDAYYFLAGAQGSGRPAAAHEPFFKLTRFFHALTGQSYGNLGFWLPILLAPLVVFPLAFLAWREDLPEAVLPMGIVAGGTMGFLVRTRLGYYDHDMLSLLLSVLFCSTLLVFLDRWRARSQALQASSEPQNAFKFGPVAVCCLLAGLSGWAWITFYPSGEPVLAAVMGMALVPALVMTRGARARAVIVLALGLTYLLAVNLVWGLALLGVLVLAWGPFFRWFRGGSAFWALAACCWLAVFFLGNLDGQLAEVFRQLAKYAPMVPEGNRTADSLALPSVMHSVREARLLPWHVMAERSGVTWWLFGSGVVGYVYLCWKRPLYLLFLPMLALAVGAVTLGARFTMYGGVPVGLGLGLGLALLMSGLGLRQRVRAVVLTSFALVAGMLLWAQTGNLKPTPILSPEYARTLLHLRETTPPDARIWLWWDYGYAAQYYAQRASFGDGAMNSRDHLYPLALVHATASSRQAAQMIRMVTQTQQEQWERAGAALVHGQSAPWSLYLQPPLGLLLDMDPESAQRQINALADDKQPWPDDLPPQYLLLSWDNLALAGWITTFGNWNLRTGQGRGGKIQRIAGDISVDMDAGVLHTALNETLELDGYLLVSRDDRNATFWENNSGWHGLYNGVTKQFLIMDETVYRSMLVQMLLKDPQEFAEDFELVVDNFPWARVYRVQ